MKDEYDLVIIGNGAAAFSAAIRASEITSNQISIAMVGYGKIGGTCVNVGCVPSKYLIEAAEELHTQRYPVYPGIARSLQAFDFLKLMDSLRDVVKGERKSKYVDVIKSYSNIDLIEGVASFVNGNKISVNSEYRLSGYNFIIATGSRNSIPSIPGLKEAGYLTSDTVWNINELPNRLAIIGGGAVGLELGQAFGRLGSEVTIIEAMPSLLLLQTEPEIAQTMAKHLESEGINLKLGRTVKSVTGGINGKTIEMQDRKKLEVDEILVATGRSPNVSGLNLEGAGVNYTKKGIQVDRTLKTSNPRIYAAGDVVDQKLMLETLAAREGTLAAENIYEHAMKVVDINSVPWAIFTSPQLASVGYTEAEYPTAKSRTLTLEHVPKARIMRKTDGMFKLVTDSETGRVVGVHAFAPNAAEIIMEGVYAIKFGLKIEEMIENSHIFPTIAEGIKLAGQSFIRDISKMSCCME
jgi:mercuric reductase